MANRSVHLGPNLASKTFFFSYPIDRSPLLIGPFLAGIPNFPRKVFKKQSSGKTGGTTR